MSRILFHVGMAKAGSTAIQEYLIREQSTLASRNITVAVALAPEAEDSVEVKPFDGIKINSGEIVFLMLRQPEAKRAVMVALARGLERLASEAETVVLTTEGMMQFLWRADEEVLQPLEDLSTRHKVQLVCYLRPQHTALEAAWRQWGFRTGRRPAAYIEDRAQQLNYLEICGAVKRIAPRVEFTVRPFRRDLLVDGDVVADFAQRFLKLEPGVVPLSRRINANVGLPLELVNLLSCAPPELLGHTPHQNRRFNLVRELLQGIESPTSAEVQQGQRLLQGWCHQQFEASNRRLIDDLGWATDSLVPPTDTAVNDLARLDELWRPRASPLETNAFFRLLECYLEQVG